MRSFAAIGSGAGDLNTVGSTAPSLPLGLLRLTLPDERLVRPPLTVGFFLCATLPLGLVAALAFELPLFRFECGQRLLDDRHRRLECAERGERAGVIPALRALLCIADRDLGPALNLLLPPPLLDRSFRTRLQIERFLLLRLLVERFGGCLHRRVELAILEALPRPLDRDGHRARAFACGALFVAPCRDLLVQRLRVARIRTHLE